MTISKDQVITELLAQNAPQYVASLSAAADAQQKLIDVTAKASTQRPAELAGPLVSTINALNNAAEASAKFNAGLEFLEKTGNLEEGSAERLTRVLERQSKALRDNAAAAERNAAALRAAGSTGVAPTQTNVNLAQVRLGALNQQRLVPEAGGRTDLTAVLAGLGQQEGATRRVLQATTLKTQAIKQQGEEEGRAAKGPQISYLSTLSAIHAASFIATNRTFTLLGSVATLGLAFNRAGIQGSVFGLSIAAVAATFNAFTTSVGRLEEVLLTAASGIAKVGVAFAGAAVAGAAAATRLASGVEDELAVIVALTQPTRDQLLNLEETISSIGRHFGVSAADVTSAASLYIRAGGDIEKAIGGATEQVIALQVASKGELVPAQAARSIVTVTNAFKVGADEAANAIVGLAQKSAFSFTEVTQAFQQAGPLAANLGVSLLDLSAVMGVLANNGLRGQVAGSGFKQVLLDLLNPSDKAAAALQRNNIALLDTNKNLRPLPDIFSDLNKAFGATAKEIESGTRDLSTAGDLVAIFGARANLAASIIARSGPQAFNDMREAIQSVIATDVANVMLLPTSAQARILATQIQELARAFGGPLNVAIGSQIRQLNEFIALVGRKPFELAGRTLVAIGTGEGFGPIIEQIQELTAEQPRLQQFVLGVITVLLTLRDTAVDIVAPAFATMADTIATAVGGINLDQAFSGAGRVIAIVGTLTADAARGFGQLVSDIITANQRGQEIKDTFSGLITVVGTGLVGAFVLAALPMAATIVILEAIGKAVLANIAHMGKFNNAWDLGWQVAKDSVNNFLKATAPGLQAFGNVLVNLARLPLPVDSPQQLADRVGELKDSFGVLENVLAKGNTARLMEQQFGTGTKAAAALDAQIQRLTVSQQQITSLLQNRGRITESGELLPDLTDTQLQQKQEELKGINDQLIHLQQIREQFGTGGGGLDKLNALVQIAQQEAESLGGADGSLANVFERLKGDLPDVFGLLATQLAESEDKLNALLRGGGAEVDTDRFFPNVDQAKGITTQIDNLLRETLTSIQDFGEDSANKVADFVESNLLRILNITGNARTQMKKLDESSELRRLDIIDAARISRQERDALQFVRDFWAGQQQIEDQNNARRDLRESQQEQRDGSRRNRVRQDRDSDLSHQQQQEENNQNILNQLQDQAFNRQQQNAERTFSRTQDLAERQLENQLSAAAAARQEQQQLARATTPEERARANESILQSRADRAFQQGQDQIRENFRRSQETARQTFQRTQEDQSFRFRISNDFAQFNFRLALEKRYLAERRRLEDQDLIDDQGRETAKLEVRLQREREAAANRLNIERQTQRIQDQLQDVGTQRQLDREARDTTRQKRDIAAGAVEQILDVVDQTGRGGEKLLAQQDKTLRGIRQRALERAQDLLAQPGGAGAAPRILTVLGIINETLDDSAELFHINIERANEFLNLVNRGGLQELQRAVPGLDVAPHNPTVPLPFTPGQPFEAQAQAAIALINNLPVDPAIRRLVALGVYDAMVQAEQTGVDLAHIDLSGLTISAPDLSPAQLLERLTR